MVAESVSVGLPSVPGTQRSAVRATTMTKPIQTMPIMASLLRFSLFQASPHMVRDEVCAPAAAAAAFAEKIPRVSSPLASPDVCVVSSAMPAYLSFLGAPKRMRGSRKA